MSSEDKLKAIELDIFISDPKLKNLFYDVLFPDEVEKKKETD
jgi:hypothetical protein